MTAGATTSQLLRHVAERARPRRLRLYGVGLGRTGTTTLSESFARHRSAHETDARRMLPMATRVIAGALSPTDPSVVAELGRRERRRRLEVDVAQFLTPFVGTLAGMYDDAQFVLTVRDCFSWLESRVEKFHRGAPFADPAWGPWFAALFGTERPHAPEEAALREAGLPPVASFFRAWSSVNEAVLSAVPDERLLVVRTDDLSRSAERLAQFAGVPASDLVAPHSNRSRDTSGILAKIPRAHLVAEAEAHCAPLMQRHWGPQWTELAHDVTVT